MIFKIFVFLLIASINERINAQRNMLRQTIGAATIARMDTRSAGGKQCLQCLQDHAPRCISRCKSSGVVCAQCLYAENADRCRSPCGTAKYFYPSPSVLYDIPAGRSTVSKRQDSSREVRVETHNKGYSTANGACARASLGVTAAIEIDVQITATTEKNVRNISDSITNELKQSAKEEFNEQFSSEYSLDVGFEWLGISSDGEYKESSHEDSFVEGKESVTKARKAFSEAVKQQNSKTVTIKGNATLEGRTSTPAEYCIFYAVEKVTFKDGTELFVVNDNSKSGKTATSDGVEVPNEGSTLKVISN